MKKLICCCSILLIMSTAMVHAQQAAIDSFRNDKNVGDIRFSTMVQYLAREGKQPLVKGYPECTLADSTQKTYCIFRSGPNAQKDGMICAYVYTLGDKFIYGFIVGRYKLVVDDEHVVDAVAWYHAFLYNVVLK